MTSDDGINTPNTSRRHLTRCSNTPIEIWHPGLIPPARQPDVDNCELPVGTGTIHYVQMDQVLVVLKGLLLQVVDTWKTRCWLGTHGWVLENP